MGWSEGTFEQAVRGRVNETRAIVTMGTLGQADERSEIEFDVEVDVEYFEKGYFVDEDNEE